MTNPAPTTSCNGVALPASKGTRQRSLPLSTRSRNGGTRRPQGLNAIEGVRCIVPNATFYLFPNVTEVMQRKGLTVYDEFRRKALHETGVSFCTRMHFGRAVPNESDQYVRFAYSGIDVADIEEAMERFKMWCDA